MCEKHDKVYGREAIVQWEAVSRGLLKVCDGRARYLEQQAESFKAWLKKKNDDPQGAINNIIYWHFDHQYSVSDIQVDTTLTPENRGQVEGELEDEFRSLLEANVTRSMYSMEGQLHWWQARVFVLREELKLHEKISDQLDKIPLVFKLKPKAQEPWRAFIRTCFRRLDDLRALGKLGFDGWYVFTSQLYSCLGRRNPMKLKHDLLLLPDRLNFYEKRMAEEKARLEAEALDLSKQEKTLDELDNELIREIEEFNKGKEGNVGREPGKTFPSQRA